MTQPSDKKSNLWMLLLGVFLGYRGVSFAVHVAYWVGILAAYVLGYKFGIHHG